MITFLSATIAMCLPGAQVDPQWAAIPNVYYLADRTDKQGVVAVTFSDKAFLLDSKGAVEATHSVPPNSRVLCYRGEGLERPELLSAKNNIDLLSSQANYWPLTFGQGLNKVIIMPGCTVLTKDSAFSVPKFGRWGAVAVRNDGRAVVVIEAPMDVPILTEYSFNGTEWSRAREAITPTIEELGYAAPLARFNDARFVDEETIVFIGKVSVLQPVSWADADKHLTPIIPSAELTLDARANSTALLFTVNLRTRVTRVISRLRVSDSPEPGGPFFGRLSVSADSKFLYILGKEQISRIDMSTLQTKRLPQVRSRTRGFEAMLPGES